MARIPWPTSSSPGERPQEGAGRVINAYIELRGDNLGPIYKRAPGLLPAVDTAQSSFRGAIVMPGVIYAGFDGVIVAIERGATSDGVEWLVSNHGSLAGTDKLFFARNNNSTPDIVGVSELGAFIITSEGVDDYPDEDVGSPNAVAFLAGYFFFTYGNGQCRTSGINTTDINPVDVATAEQHPDGLIRPQPYRGFMLLCGRRSIEVWQNNANPEGFPFSWSHTIPNGLISPHAMAGGTDEFADELMWVADDNTVRRLEGYGGVVVSEPDLNRALEQLQDKAELEACVYTSSGHKFWQLSCASWSWVYDLTTGKWHERDSYLQGRSRITQSFPVSADLMGWSGWLCGDTNTGYLAQITRATFKEMGGPFRWRLESSEVKNFPNRIQVARADFEFTVGVGIATGLDPIEVDPSVLISWSNDGGTRWSNPLIRKLGRQQKTGQRVTVTNTGLSGPCGRRWRLDVYDPVHVSFFGGEQSAAVRAK